MPDWLLVLAYVLGWLGTAYWIMWLERDSHAAGRDVPVGAVGLGMVWPIVLPLLLGFFAITALANVMWDHVQRRSHPLGHVPTEGTGGRPEK